MQTGRFSANVAFMTSIWVTYVNRLDPKSWRGGGDIDVRQIKSLTIQCLELHSNVGRIYMRSAPPYFHPHLKCSVNSPRMERSAEVTFG